MAVSGKMLRPCYGTYLETGVSRKLACHRPSGPAGRQGNLLILMRKLRLDDTCFQFVRFKGLDDSEVNMKPNSRLYSTYEAPLKKPIARTYT